MEHKEKLKEFEEVVELSVKYFRYFIRYIFPFSFENWTEASHLEEWADILSGNNCVSLLAPRGHLKSTLGHAYIMWRIWSNPYKSEKWLYMSYKHGMASAHISIIRELILFNPFFKGFSFIGEAEGVIRLTYDGVHSFKVYPAGVLSFSRGWHGTGVLCDDVLADPSNRLDPQVLKKIERLFWDNIYYLPNPGGFLHILGTPQHPHDLFNSLRLSGEWSWYKYTGIVDRKNKIALWENMHPYSKLIKQEKNMPSSFRKEIMCEPVWDTDRFLDDELVNNCVSLSLAYDKGSVDLSERVVVSGMDIGKKRHPSHIIIMYYSDEEDRLITLWEEWLDGVDYHKQIEILNSLCEFYGVDRGFYDNTRGEFEGFYEQDQIHKSQKPFNFNLKTKNLLSSNLERYFGEGKISLVHNTRTVNQLLAVNNDLDALETDEGHGESFWSLALACYCFEEVNNKKGGVYAV